MISLTKNFNSNCNELATTFKKILDFPKSKNSDTTFGYIQYQAKRNKKTLKTLKDKSQNLFGLTLSPISQREFAYLKKTYQIK